MSVFEEMSNYTILTGDSEKILAGLPDNSVDAIVTDPPYGLSRNPNMEDVLAAWLSGKQYEGAKKGFMGNEWDSFVPSPSLWKECFRVLKHGGHLLAFAGTRTQDLMALSIRLAGFEIRDMIAWTYGVGFPKSYNVSRGIDAQDAVANREERALRATAWLRGTGITAKEINDLTKTSMASHYLSRGSQPQVPTREHLETLRPHLPEIPAWFEELVDQRVVSSSNLKNRPVVRSKVGANTKKVRLATNMHSQGFESQPNHTFNITSALTPEAQAWEGWGTALKPALEPITLARKPLVGGVADNVLKYGTGAINIDGCRVPSTDKRKFPAGTVSDTEGVFGGGGGLYGDQPRTTDRSPNGRFPANLIHDGSIDVNEALNGNARYFYCAKATKADRNEGLDGANTHNTVKPTALMQYLCRLVTPPNGVILDPFCGSGSTGKAAMLEGFRFIGIEMDEQFADIARARVEHAAQSVKQKDLFS